MAVFEDVKLSWKGKEHTIPADQMLRAIARVEDVLSLGQLYESMAKSSLPVAKLSICYGILLRTAGVEVSDDEVYEGMFEDSGIGLRRKAFQAIGLLQTLMVPPASIRSKEKPAKGEEAAGKPGASSPSATG